MAGEINETSLKDTVVKDRHVHSAAEISKTKLAERALASFPHSLFELRVWDSLEMLLPGPGNVEGAQFSSGFSWDPNSADAAFFVADRRYRVVAITARVEVVGTDGGAVTAVVRKAASGTDIASGTALHTGSINLKGTVDTNQSLTLSATSSDLDITAGQAIGIDFTGTLTAARGCVSILLAPANSADDLQLYTGTFGTHLPSVRSRDLKAVGATTVRCRACLALPTLYTAGEDVQLRLRCGMNTAVADTTATIDVEAYEVQSDGTLSSDLCTTDAVSMNSLTLTDKDFTLTATSLAPGDRLDVRISIAVNDAAGATAVIAVLQDLILRCDVRP